MVAEAEHGRDENSKPAKRRMGNMATHFVPSHNAKRRGGGNGEKVSPTPQHAS